MKRLAKLGLGLSVVVLAGCSSGMNLARSGPDGFDGVWQIDAARSDVTGRDWGEDDNGTYFGDDRTYSRDVGRYTRPNRSWRLPDVLQIDSNGDAFRIEDERGQLIEEVVLDDGRYERGSRRYTATRGRWNGDREVEIRRQLDDDRRVTQTFSLQDRGRQMVVHTMVDRPRGTRTFTWVYARS